MTGAMITQTGQVTIPDDVLLSAVTVTVTYTVSGQTPAQSAFDVTVEAAAPVFDPEAGLTLTRSVPADSLLTNGDYDPLGSLVIAFDAADIAAPSGAMVAELGGGAAGMYFGIRPNQTMILRAGNGTDSGLNETALQELAPSQWSATGTYVAEFLRNPDGTLRVRLWLDGAWIADLTSDAAFATGLFGGDDGAYLRAGGSGGGLPRYDGGTDEASAVPSGTFSPLRVYEGQTITPEAGTTPLTDLPAVPQDLGAIPMAGFIGVHFSPSISGGAAALRGYEIEVDSVVQPEVANPFWFSSLVSDGTHNIRVRGVNVNGVTGPWTDPVSATVTPSLPAPMTTTLSDTLSFNGVTLTLDRQMPIAQTVDGRPMIISVSDFNIINVTPASGVQPGGGTIGNGMMRDPSWFRMGRTQGFDELIAAGSDATTRVPYVAGLNVDPAVSGPLFIAEGSATSLVKSIRNDQHTRPWADAPSQQWAIGDYAVFSVMPFALPNDATRPAITPLNKFEHIQFGRHLNLNVLRNLPVPTGNSVSFAVANESTVFDHAFYGDDNGETQNVFGPDDNYSAQWQERRKLAWLALHSDVPSAAEKTTLAYKMITHALDLEAIVDAGWIGRQGAGQALGFIPFMYFGGFLIQDRALLQKARTTLSSELGSGRHAYVPLPRIGVSGAYPDSNDQFNAPFLPEHLDTAHIYGDAKGAAINARYSSLIQDGAASATLAMILLQDGPDGETGIEAITGNSDPIGPANPTSAGVATLDAYRAVHTKGAERRYYDAWRDLAGVRYTEAPKQLPKLGSDAEFVRIDNGVAWDWTNDNDGVSGVYASAEVSYGIDQRSWTEVTGVDKSGQITDLMVGQKYYMRIRYVDTLGRKGIWSDNLGGWDQKDNKAAPEVYVVTPTGTAADAAPVNRRQPEAAHRPYLQAPKPHYEVLPGEQVIPREAVDIFPSVGDWTGHPAPTYRWKIRRTGADVTNFEPFVGNSGVNWDAVSKYTRGPADFSDAPNDTWLQVVIEASNASGTAEATGPRIFMPQPISLAANVLVDTQFTDAFRADYPDLVAGMTAAFDTEIYFSNDYYNANAAQPGYIFNSKDEALAALQIRFPDTPAQGQQYRITAHVIIGSSGQTAVNVRGGAHSTQIASFDPTVDDRLSIVTDYVHTIPSGAAGQQLLIEARLTGAGGGTTGSGVGFAYLRVERL